MGRGRKRPPGVPGGAEPGSPGEPGGVRPGTPGGGGSGSGPRRFTEAEQRAFLEELEGSGESVQAFARRIGVTVWTVYWWRKAARRLSAAKAPRGAGPLPWKRGRGSRRSGQRPASGAFPRTDRTPGGRLSRPTGSPVCRSRTSGSSGACRRPRSGSGPGRTRRAGRRRSRRRRADGRRGAAACSRGFRRRSGRRSWRRSGDSRPSVLPRPTCTRAGSGMPRGGSEPTIARGHITKRQVRSCRGIQTCPTVRIAGMRMYVATHLATVTPRAGRRLAKSSVRERTWALPYMRGCQIQ